MASMSIPAQSIKDFAAALKCLRQYSDELQLQATPEALKLSAVAPTRSAYAAATFEPAFFARYRVTKHVDRAPPKVQIELALKPLTRIIPPKAWGIDSCDIVILDPESDPRPRPRKRRRGSSPAEDEGAEDEEDGGSTYHRVIVRQRSPSGIVKTFTLQYSSSPMLVPTVSRDDCTSSWVCHPSLLKQWTDHFHGASRDGTVGNAKGTEEISFWHREPGKIRMKSIEGREEGAEVIVPKNPDVFAKGARQMTTGMTVSTAEFDEYSVPHAHLVRPGPGSFSSAPTAPPLRDPDHLQPLLTFSIKEFRAMVEAAQSLGSSPIDAAFSKGGEPLLATVRAEGLTMEFVISTNGDDPAGMRKADLEVKPRIDRSSTTAGPSRAQSTSMPPPAVPLLHRRPPAVVPPLRNGAPASHGNGLFRPADEEEEEEEADVTFGDDDLSFAALAKAEEQAIAASQARVIESSQRAEREAEARKKTGAGAGKGPDKGKAKVLVPESTREGASNAGGSSQAVNPDGDGGDTTEDEDGDESQLKPTQRPGMDRSWEIDID